MAVVIFLVAGAVAGIGLVQKVLQLRRDPRNPSLRHVCILLAALAAASLVSYGPIYIVVDELAGVPNLSRYLQHTMALIAAASIQAVFLHLNNPGAGALKRVFVRWAILAVALAVMGVLFASTSFDVEAPHDFAERYAHLPAVRYYMIVFLSYLALSMSDILRMSTRYARQLPRSPLRLGIRLLTAGSLVGLAYVVQKAIYIAVVISGHTAPWPEEILSSYLPVLGIMLVASGVAIAPITRIAQDAWHWPRRYRLDRQLQPLWQAIIDVNPDVSLSPPRRFPLPWQAEMQLYRRVVELRDGLGDLTPYTDKAVSAEAAAQADTAGLPIRQVQAVSDAAAAASAVAYLAGSERIPTPADRRHQFDQDVGDDYETDAEWLAQVAVAYTTSPIVAKVRARTRAFS